MNSQASTIMRSRWLPVGVVILGWAAIAAAWWLSPHREAPNREWGTQTLAVVVLVSAVMAVTAIEAARTWHRRPAKLHALEMTWTVLGSCIWFFGGLWTALVGLFYTGTQLCRGSSAGASYGCLNRPGPDLELLGWLLTFSATGVLVLMFRSRHRSRVAAALAPALIIGLYLLAMALWQPHDGFGVPHRTSENPG
jgi:hypothetical protein